MDSLDDLRVLDEFSNVTDGTEPVLYPSEERLSEVLVDIGYTMPTAGLYTLEQYLSRIGLHGDEGAGLWMASEDIVETALSLMEQAAGWPEVDGSTLQALRRRLARWVDTTIA